MTFNKDALSFVCILKQRQVVQSVSPLGGPAFGSQPPIPSHVPESSSEMQWDKPLLDSYSEFNRFFKRNDLAAFLVKFLEENPSSF